MGSLTLTTTLVPRGPAAAIVLDDEQVAIVGEGATHSKEFRRAPQLTQTGLASSWPRQPRSSKRPSRANP